jgi:GNAT superfamily N-acetyltransferase
MTTSAFVEQLAEHVENEQLRRRRHELRFEYLEQLADDETVEAYVNLCFSTGVLQGFYPADRARPTGGEHVIVARDGDDPIGFATFYPLTNPGSSMWLDLLWVERRWRRAGVGRALCVAVRERTRETKLAAVSFGTGIDNEAMAGVGRVLGFAPQSTVFTLPMGEQA